MRQGSHEPLILLVAGAGLLALSGIHPRFFLVTCVCLGFSAFYELGVT